MFAISKIAWFLVTPSNALFGLAIVGTLLSALGRPRWGIRLALPATASIALVGLSPVGLWLLAPLEDRFPAYVDEGAPITGVVVLGGAVHANVSFGRRQLAVGDAAERVIAMADLARRFPDARIVFSGGSGAVLGPDLPEADAVAQFGGVLGIDPTRIIYENRSRTTYENAVESYALTRPAPGERWLLVTSSWHMPRAIGAFRRVGFVATPYPVDYRTGDAAGFRRWEPALSVGLERFDLAVREWLGLLVYRLVGRTDDLFPGYQDAHP